MPPRRTTPKGYEKARVLRREMTPLERNLWAGLRGEQLGVSFRRQHAIGPYIVDFCCIKKHLIIELDGSQHIDQRRYDNERSEYLAQRGYMVLRFWNNEVNTHLDEVLAEVSRVLIER